MTFREALVQRRRAVLDDWFRAVSEGYPPAMRDMLGKGDDRFGNPVGSTLARGIEAIYDALANGSDDATLAEALDGPVRLRAVQSLSPSEAIGFVFQLKGAVRHALAKPLRKEQFTEDLESLERRIDHAALVAFDIYLGCREQLLRIRSNEALHGGLRPHPRPGQAAQGPATMDPSSSGEGRRRGATP